jgi:hypothetical protein
MEPRYKTFFSVEELWAELPVGSTLEDCRRHLPLFCAALVALFGPNAAQIDYDKCGLATGCQLKRELICGDFDAVSSSVCSLVWQFKQMIRKPAMA